MTTHKTIRNVIRALVTGLFAAVLSSASTAALAGGKGGGGNHAGNRPAENVSLNYGKVQTTYTQQSASKKTGTTKGKTQTYYKIEMNNAYISHY